MKKYDKEKLHEYAKELFSLCLEKGFYFESCFEGNYIIVNSNKGHHFVTLIGKKHFKDYNIFCNNMPIWELIEHVKAL